MVELSKERMDQILHEESIKKEDVDTILRGIYTRYMRLFEKYFADPEALDDEKIAEMKKYHEETVSLTKYYYMDIPNDICTALRVFDTEYTEKMLGKEWQKFLSDKYDEFCKKKGLIAWGTEHKPAFIKYILEDFYDEIGEVFRTGFGTTSQTAKDVISGISGMIFGNKDK